jgi:hypothetical protein
MTRNRITLMLLSLSTALLATTTADAQVGSLIKRKVKEAVQKPKQEEPAPAAAPTKDIYADPDVVPITTDQLERLEKAMKYEVTERDAVRNEKPPKTPEEYGTCSQTTSMSPEAQKITNDWAAKLNPNAAADEAAKSMLKVNADILALVAKRCGEEPREWEVKRNLRLQEIPQKASDIAMPDGWVRRKAGGEGSSAHSAPSGPWIGDTPGSGESLEAAQFPHPFQRAYAVLKERITPACVAIGNGTIVVGSAGSGVKIPLPGPPSAGLYIYSNAEIAALAPKCPSLTTWLKQLL